MNLATLSFGDITGFKIVVSDGQSWGKGMFSVKKTFVLKNPIMTVKFCVVKKMSTSVR